MGHQDVKVYNCKLSLVSLITHTFTLYLNLDACLQGPFSETYKEDGMDAVLKEIQSLPTTDFEEGEAHLVELDATKIKSMKAQSAPFSKLLMTTVTYVQLISAKPFNRNKPKPKFIPLKGKQEGKGYIADKYDAQFVFRLVIWFQNFLICLIKL